MFDATLNDLLTQTQTQSPAGAVAVDDLLGQILGIRLDDDIGRFRAALARAFPLANNPATGVPTVRYVPPSFAVQTLHSGGIPVTGALAGIQAQTTLLAGEALTLLARLRPRSCACDGGIDSLRDLIRGELEELPRLFSGDSSPTPQRIDMTFKLLTGADSASALPPTPDPALFGGQVGILGKRLGMDGAAQTIEDEEVRTDFRIFASYIWMLQNAWAALRADFDKAGTDSLGTVLHAVQRQLLTVGIASKEFQLALDHARVGSADRMTFTLAAVPPITLADLLSWIDEIASPKGLAVISAGQDGIAVFAPVVDQLLDLVCNVLKPVMDGGRPYLSPNTEGCAGCADPTFLSTERTRSAFNKLALQLTALCREIKRALPAAAGARPSEYQPPAAAATRKR